MRKKLLLVNKAFYPTIGGVETVVQQYASFARDAGFDVTVLCVNPKFSWFKRVEDYRSIRVVRCGGVGTFFSMPVSISFFYHLWRESRAADIVHGHYPFPLFDIGSCLISSLKPMLLTWHSDILRQKYFRKLIYPFTSRLLGRSLVTVTSPSLRTFSSLLSKCREDSVVLLPLSVPLSEYVAESPCGLTDYLGRPLPDKFALFMGRFCYYKGIMFLLETIKDNPNMEKYSFVLVGGGELLAQAIDFIDEHGLDNVYILGRFATENEKRYLMGAARFLVFPSIVETEAFGIVQLEAMAFSKPVINTDLKTGVPWVSPDNETGLTVEVHNRQALAVAIEKLFCDEGLYIKLSEAARARVVENFSDEIISQRYLGILQALLASGCRVPSDVGN